MNEGEFSYSLFDSGIWRDLDLVISFSISSFSFASVWDYFLPMLSFEADSLSLV